MTSEILADLDRIIDQAKWAHGYAYGKTGRGLTAEHGADLSKSEAERMKGPMFDIEIGNHKARVAYQQAALALDDAHRRLTFAADQDRSPHRPAPTLLPTSPPAELEQVAKVIRWYLDTLTLEHHERTLKHIRKQFDEAANDLTAALAAGEAEGIAHGEKPCKTCGVRPQAERDKGDGTKRVSAAGECDTCATWRRRNGTIRPKTLDSGPVNEARAAQARRMARGEGWGAA